LEVVGLGAVDRHDENGEKGGGGQGTPSWGARRERLAANRNARGRKGRKGDKGGRGVEQEAKVELVRGGRGKGFESSLSRVEKNHELEKNQQPAH